jgi:CheY-like chemotaxis protein
LVAKSAIALADDLLFTSVSGSVGRSLVISNRFGRRTPAALHASSAWAWLWPFLVAIVILGTAGVVAVLQYPQFGSAGAAAFAIGTTLGTLALAVVAIFVRRSIEQLLRQTDAERAKLLASERAANAQEEQASRIKADVATLSHELRTPLNAILGWVGVLRHDRRSETIAKAIDVVDRNCHRLTEMIDDVLSVGQHTNGTEPPADVFPGLLSSVNVLVLDDEPDGREVLKRLLEDAGASVHSAACAEDAIDELQHGYVPDLIVSDISMPGQDGYAFMRRVRQMDAPVRNVPAAALTALARVEDRRRALLAGYQTHLAKPVDPAELVATVASLTGRTGRIVA